MEKTFTCIVCPKSCDITVKDDNGTLSASGFACPRGEEYAKNEYLHPQRMLTSTVKVIGGEFARLGVVGSKEVPKEMLRDCLALVYRTTVKAPVQAGSVIIRDILGTGCDIVAATNIAAME